MLVSKYVKTKILAPLEILHHHRQCSRQETKFVRGMQAMRRLFLEYHPLDKKSQDEIVFKYRQLDERLRSEGLYKCSYGSYAFEFARYMTLFILFATFLHYSYYALSGLSLGLFWNQLGFTAHDAGHVGIDPDIEHMPFFAIFYRFFSSLRSAYYDRDMTFNASYHTWSPLHYTYNSRSVTSRCRPPTWAFTSHSLGKWFGPQWMSTAHPGWTSSTAVSCWRNVEKLSRRI